MNKLDAVFWVAFIILTLLFALLCILNSFNVCMYNAEFIDKLFQILMAFIAGYFGKRFLAEDENDEEVNIEKEEKEEEIE